jgi:hypothetical protein
MNQTNDNTVKILMLGDVFARTGRRLVKNLLPGLIDRRRLDLVIANAENAAGGLGLTVRAAEELLDAGVDVMTSGNHIFRHREIQDYLDREHRLLRPDNFPEPCPGVGRNLVATAAGFKVGVVCLLGRTFMKPLDCPFAGADRAVAGLRDRGADTVLVDMHAEATSEKKALAFYLDGRAGAVVGTHTHVQTADECVFPGGTAYISDLGMTGPHDSVIGMKPESVLSGFLTGRPSRFEASKSGGRLEGALIFLEAGTGRAINIERIQIVDRR